MSIVEAVVHPLHPTDVLVTEVHIEDHAIVKTIVLQAGDIDIRRFLIVRLVATFDQGAAPDSEVLVLGAATSTNTIIPLISAKTPCWRIPRT